MRRSARAARAITLGGVAALLVWQIAAVPAIADAEYDRQQAIWQDLQNADKAIGIPTKALQELWGNEASQQLLDDYGTAVMIISINRELMVSGNLEAAAKIIGGKLGDMALQELAPGFHNWLGWFGWAKTGMELFKGFVFDPMVEQSQVETYIGLRKAGNGREDAYAGVRGLGYTIERLMKEYKRQNPDNLRYNPDGSISQRWQSDFDIFVLASFEAKYLDQIHRETQERFRAAAADAERQLEELRAQLLVFLEEYRVSSVVLDPPSVELRPGEQAVFSAVAVFAGRGAARSATGVTGDATWSGGTSDNVFLAKESDVDKNFVVEAKYAEITGTASVSVVEADCGDDGHWDIDARKCVCESGYWNADLGECVSEEPESDGEVKEVLSDLEHDFYGAVDLFDEHYQNFIARLHSLGAGEPEAICTDANLAYSFTRAAASYDLVHRYYVQAWELLGREDRGLNFDAIAVGNYTDDTHVRDQIRMEMFRKDYLRITGLAEEDMINQLAQFAPGCDPEDLLDRGSRTAEDDQNAEAGIDIPGETIPPGGGGGGCGGVLCFVNQGPVIRELQGNGSCSGGSANVSITSFSFPSEIRVDQSSVTVEISFSWSSSGSGREEVLAGAVVWLLNASKQSQEYRAFSGSRIFRATFSRSELDFALPAGSCVAVVTVGVDCGYGGLGTASAQAVDGYLRSGGN